MAVMKPTLALALSVTLRASVALACTFGAGHVLAQPVAPPLSVASPSASPSASPTGSAALIDNVLSQQLQRLAHDSAAAAWGPTPGAARIEVEIGQLDPRLSLAPCQHIEPYLPAGTRLLGRSRVGLRCLQGPTRWNIYLPVTVKLIARSTVASTALPAGSVIRAHHLAEAEVDLAASSDPAIQDPDVALGRTLARALSAGDALRRGDLKLRQWFAAGDTVRVVAQGPGFSISAEGLALSAGLEGQRARVQTESGRIVSGMPIGERRVEVAL